MNKRKAKKEYKKKHGENPPSAKRLKAAERELYENYNLTPEQIAAVTKAAKTAFAAARAIAEMGKEISKTFTEIAASIEREE